jgi:uncharacterized protein
MTQRPGDPTGLPVLSPEKYFMKCPIDGSELNITERQGIEIDYCPRCRGVWLDRGEMDKLIERAGQPYAPPAASAAPGDLAPPAQPLPPRRPVDDRGYREDRRYDRDDDDNFDTYRDRERRPGRRRSFLDDLFDFD